MKMEEFSLLINNNQIIIEVGKSLAKSINKNILGEKLLDNFEIKHPKFVRDASSLNNYTGNIISLIYIDNRALRLRGVINKINGGYYTFNGTLWASDTSVLNMLNLTY